MRHKCQRKFFAFIGLAAVLAGGLWLLSSLAAQEAGEQNWFPLKVGNRWTYSVKKERKFTMDGQAGRTMTLQGTETWEVTSTTQEFGSQLVYEVKVTYQEKSEEFGIDRKLTPTLLISVSNKGVFFHAQRLEAPYATGKLVKYDPPLQSLKLPVKVGEKWKVGVIREGDLRIALIGQVEGYEDVKVPAGTFRNCLKVRYQGQVSGKMNIGGQAIAVESGSSDETEWHAEGVGRVKQFKKQTMKLTLPDGRQVMMNETITRLLQAGYKVKL